VVEDAENQLNREGDKQRSVGRTCVRRKPDESGAGSIDDLDMFSGITTYSMILLKGKCWARLLGVGKGGVIA